MPKFLSICLVPLKTLVGPHANFCLCAHSLRQFFYLPTQLSGRNLAWLALWPTRPTPCISQRLDPELLEGNWPPPTIRLQHFRLIKLIRLSSGTFSCFHRLGFSLSLNLGLRSEDSSELRQPPITIACLFETNLSTIMVWPNECKILRQESGSFFFRVCMTHSAH